MKIGPDDSRYAAVVEKRFNKRFKAQPDYVCLATSTAEVISAVNDAVAEERRVVVTSGGHSLEGLASEADVRVIIDVSPMKRVWYDASLDAIGVEAGATVGETFRAVHEGWGVVIPLGEYPEIGIGGHVLGGAFGFLCRQHGLAADYLYAIEVVTVDADGRASAIVATREQSDPNRELWWAHTGGGGGNFGIVTRYWFKELPVSPASITTFKCTLNWSELTQEIFARFMRNYGEWAERNSAPDSHNISLFNLVELHRQQFGSIVLRGVSTAADAERQIAEFVAAMGVSFSTPEMARMEWLDFALNPFPDLFGMPPGGVSMKGKDAMLTQRLTDPQIRVAYKHLTRADVDVMGGMMGLASYGGRVNAVASDATAASQRRSILDIACTAGWVDATDAEQNLRWVREFYRDLFADTGGVPVPNERYDGSFINHPDVDHTDPAYNTSGVAWFTLFYQDNYPRLQRVKAQWDPRNIFHHAMSVTASR